jgi:hypothetical protein
MLGLTFVRSEELFRNTMITWNSRVMLFVNHHALNFFQSLR